MPTNYNFRNKNDYLKLKFPNVSTSGRRLFLLGDQNGMTPGPNQENAAFRFANTSVVSLNSANLSPGKENEALRITPIGINNPWQVVDLYVALTPRPDLLDFVGGTTRTYRVSFSYRANASSIGKTFSASITDAPFGGAGSLTQSSNAFITIANTNWNRVENITQSRTYAADRWVAFSGFNALAPNNTWTSSDYIEIADFSFTWDEQPVTTTSFDDQFIPADTFRQGNLYGWGVTNRIGIVPDGSTYKSSPVLVNNFSNWKTLNEPGGVNTSTFTMLAIDYSGYLWFWGNSNVPSNWPLSTTIGLRQTYTTPQLSSTSNTWTTVGQFDNGGGAAIKTNGTLWTWGRATLGRLGINSSVDSPTLVQEFTSSSNWKTLSCGGYHVAAIKTDGTLWTWGRNNFGQLGVNDTIERSTPVQEFTSSTNWKSVSCSDISTSAIKTDGTMFLWGSGDITTPRMPSGASSGLPSEGAKSIPYRENTLSTNWKQVTTVPSFAGSGVYNVAIKNDGTAWLWQLAPLTNNSVNLNTSIIQFANENNFFWKKCFAGNPTYLIKSDGTLWGYGDNSEGQLGIGDLIFRATPVQIASFSNIKEVKSTLPATGTATTWALRYIDPII